MYGAAAASPRCLVIGRSPGLCNASVLFLLQLNLIFMFQLQSLDLRRQRRRHNACHVARKLQEPHNRKALDEDKPERSKLDTEANLKPQIFATGRAPCVRISAWMAASALCASMSLQGLGYAMDLTSRQQSPVSQENCRRHMRGPCLRAYMTLQSRFLTPCSSAIQALRSPANAAAQTFCCC